MHHPIKKGPALMALLPSGTPKIAALLILLLTGWADGLQGQTATDYPQPSYQALLQEDDRTVSSENPKQQDEELYELIKLFVDTLDQIDRNYVKEVDRRDLINGAIQGMLGKLDRHSNYIPPSNVNNFRSRVENEFGGIGIRIRNDDGKPTIITPMFGSPAYKAGIRPGDIIVSIDDEATEGKSPNAIVEALKGKIGSKVKLAIHTPASQESKTVEVERSLIRVKSVLGVSRNDDDSWNYFLDEDNKIGYLLVTNFGRHTTGEILDAVKQLKSQGIKGLIVDLRYNPGGLLSAAIQISDMFVKEGRIVSTEGRATPKRVWDAKAPGTFDDFPMAVLINQFSASASEILSACLQDHARAVIVGQRSFGKGSVQNIIELEEGKSVLKLTTAGYFRPSGKNIDKPSAGGSDEWGVSPNEGFEVTFNEEQNRLLRDARRDYDIVLNGATHNPREGKEYLQLIDTQLLTAQNYLYSELSLPTIEIPEVQDAPTSESKDTTAEADKKDTKRPFKRHKKRQPEE
ncbi:MAG: peptidase S41 [Planctomycetaceae bacterium]|nr:peptidase S41 [Planctomycetaceae bacterium]